MGIFSPVINWCGGAEWVTLNIIDALKEQGHRIILLTNKRLDHSKFSYMFHKEVSVDQQFIFPFEVFPSANYHNIYTDAIRSLLLKSKCDVLVDTYSGAVLPGMDVVYFQNYPLLKAVETGLPYFRNLVYFYPYRSFLSCHRESMSNKLFFANSKFIAEAVKAELCITPHVLYPSVSDFILNRAQSHFNDQRENVVLTIARISKGKNLEIIPHIAKLTSKKVSFVIAGLLDSEQALDSLIRLKMELNVSDKVKIMVNVKRSILRQMLLNSKVYLHSAIDEPFGISIVEAMSSGCIPVVHDSGGPKEFVPPNLRYKSPDEAAEKVEKAIADWSTTKANELSKDANRFNENNFSKQFLSLIHI